MDPQSGFRGFVRNTGRALLIFAVIFVTTLLGLLLAIIMVVVFGDPIRLPD